MWKMNVYIQCVTSGQTFYTDIKHSEEQQAFNFTLKGKQFKIRQC